MLCIHGCRCAFVAVILMSSAEVISYVCLGGLGMSEVYILKSLGETTPPCGMPVLNWRCVDVMSALRPLM